ncbi:hypothetical protein PG1C_13830 [Rugosibacter aromaticivorans]|uniref:Uncharacterized protein n=1 Tax=Rugosibacter aromaticivorans TaxID=1565605 RepID=A0A0C5JBI0_9PROT|nr:hypothetical protein [Rugosibacter aromaticivorans]AJP49215.1 hypothetical protein PG1C_13830 [Rugosibacter aromaticivorans]TBR15603.1 MAG: hypothetical protein EPO43_03805 [Rugosibacter sp.]
MVIDLFSHHAMTACLSEFAHFDATGIADQIAKAFNALFMVHHDCSTALVRLCDIEHEWHRLATGYLFLIMLR